MLKIYKVAIGILLLINAYTQSLAKPIERDELYNAHIVVSDRSNAQWEYAVHMGLSSVLTKVSGNRYINTLPTLQDILSDADKYVQHFSYENVEENHEEKIILHIGFEKDSVRDILSHLGQSIWDTHREATLIWFFPHNASEISYTKEGDMEARYFLETAKNRGVQVLFPVGDLGLSDTLAEYDALNQDMFNKILAYSKQYHIDQVLIGEYTPDKDTAFEWHMFKNGAEFSWSSSNSVLSNAVSEAVNHFVDSMVASDAILESKEMQDTVLVGFSNVGTIQDYTFLVNMLKKNTVIETFSIASIHDDLVVFSLRTHGGSVAISNTFEQYSNLNIDTDANLDDNFQIVYRLNKS